tara:strand:+ start:508 stop:897 length:390 start_codon:yes stop_codon:yes gene_type:complete
MPPALYNCSTGKKYESKEEQIKERKKRDNISQKIRYWKKSYGYDLTKNDYEDFNKHVNIIKKIHKIHDFVVNYNYRRKSVSKDCLDTYAKNYKAINDALPIQEYLKTLNKIGAPENNIISVKNKVLDNW